MTKRALMVIADGFEEIEALTPTDILRRAGVEVVLAGLTAQEQTGAHGIRLLCDKVFSVALAKEPFNALILPGGSCGAQNLAASQLLRALIIEMFQQKKLIAAICATPAVVLAATGILDGRQATCYPGLQNLFSSSVSYRDRLVVEDGNIITAAGPAAASDFALLLAARLSSVTMSDQVSRAMLYDR